MNPKIPKSPWLRASILLAGTAAIAYVLLRGNGPLLPGPGSGSHVIWSLPDWLALVSLAALLLATPAAIICALVAIKLRGNISATSAPLWIGGAILAVLLAAVFG